MNKIEALVTQLAQPIAEKAGCELWDVTYTKEGGGAYLRVFIDKPEGVAIDDCETVSRALDAILDEKDPIPDSYIFEVSSAGLTRSLKKPEHYARFLGRVVEVRLYKSRDGAKTFSGELSSYDNGNVTIRREDSELIFTKSEIAAVHIDLL
jgi:ribosome maturation factor RimP